MWSYYYHGYKEHGSTAIGCYKSYSGYTKPGKRARASAEKDSGLLIRHSTIFINKRMRNIRGVA
ncbi:lactococcin 972 family bacteriocin [Staphylococcus simiae]|uniref:lactococcin 972 family bacteriocin n=1 Tax=Staphylococcus simiae TaxID=308354 RepID=UPI001E37D7AC|nr:lactococcin 972 family bacteriocin [Staphylococcus simiae]